MSDSLVLTGVKQVTKHKGSEMLRMNPKRGGDTHKIKRWWAPNTVNTVYEACTVFKVTQDAGVCYLAIKTSQAETFRIRIDSDLGFDFKFYNNIGINRAALFTEDMVLIEHYVFPAISGGSIMTVTPPGAPLRPVAADPISFSGSTTVSGNATVGETLTATAANYTGGVGAVSTNLLFQVSNNGTSGWSFLSGNPSTASGGTATYVLQAADSGKYIRASFQVTDEDGVQSSNSSATAAIADTFATRAANATYTYTVTVVNTAADPVNDPAVNVFAFNGVNQPNLVASPGETLAFDFSAVASNHPLGLFTDSSKTTPVTVGVELGGSGNSTLLFTPPIAGTFSYQCINHAAMGGDITVA